MHYKKYFLLLVLFLYGIISGYSKTIWEIGKPDRSSKEFALAPSSYKDFVPQGFGGWNRYFVVGQSNPQEDWPYVLPGPKDSFGGYGYWAGLALHQLPLYFQIAELPSQGSCQLRVDFLETSSEQAPLFRATINGHPFNFQLEEGESGNQPDTLTPHPQQATFNIPINILRKGCNEVIFQNMTGKWCAFDAIRFEGPEDLSIENPRGTVIKEVRFADFKMTHKGKEIQPLLVDILHKGKSAPMKVIIDGQPYKKIAEAGHTVFEIYHSSETSSTPHQIEIFVKGHKEFEEKRIVEKAKMVTPADYVDQFMGTSGSRWMIAPGPWMPMGMVKMAPLNEEGRWKSGYDYQIENIMGFSHIHEWTMAGLLMMPTTGPLKITPGPEDHPEWGYRSLIDKRSEKAQIGYYGVDLMDYDIKAELTATTRASMQRYTFPSSSSSRILVDLKFPSEYAWIIKDLKIKQINSTEIEGIIHSFCNSTGYHGEQDYKLHFVMQFSKPFSSMDGWVNEVILTNINELNNDSDRKDFYFKNDKRNHTADAGIILNYDTTEGDQILVRTGISLVSTDQARLNLTQEMAKPFNWDFEAVVEHQKEVWNSYLSRVEIETDDYLQKVKFYSNFYRALSPRNTWSDVNGKWVDMNEEIQQLEDPKRAMYGSDGYWGWHWNLVPFYNLVTPEIASNWVNTFLEFYDKGGWIPIGNPGLEYFRVMVGQPALPQIISSWQHGIRDYDIEKVYEAIIHQQTAMPQIHEGGGEVGNESLPSYLKLGYVPLGDGYHSYVSNTMEYAYQDWGVAQLAKALNDTTRYRTFMKRSENWRNIFDPSTGFVRPRQKDGSWLKDFDPYHAPGFCESNSWQYTWYVPHNVPGLIKTMGRKRFIERLNKGMEASEKVYFNALGDQFFKYPINHGNESNMQSCYLFNYAGRPDLTQKWARSIQERYYGMGPRDAYPGDEDQGQMSAWYVMATIGLFQMDGGCAVNPRYELGSPRFHKVTIHLSSQYHGGKTFVIEAPKASRENKYIKKAFLNGETLKNWWIPTQEVLKGGTLKLDMSSKR